jgi:cell division protein FtsB
MVKISKIADIYKAYQYNLENYNKLINDVEIMNKENENRIVCIKKLTIKNDDLEDEIENLQEQIKLKEVRKI